MSQTRGADLVAKVVRITIEQLADVGLARLSVPEVARLAGANKTTLYRRWPTKEDLVREALAVSMAEVQLPEPTGDLRRDLVGLGTRMAAFVTSPVGKGLVRIVFAEGDNPELRALAAVRYDGGAAPSPIDAIVGALGRRGGPARAELRLAVFTLAGAILHRVFIEHDKATPAFVERIVDLVLGGLAPEPRRRSRQKSNS